MNRLEQLVQMYNEDPSDSFIRFALGKEYEKVGNTSKAREFYTLLVKDDPTYTGTYYHLGKLLEFDGDLEEAKLTYKKGIEMSQEEGDKLSERELKEALLLLESNLS